MKSCKNLKDGLQEVATELEVARIGPQHQAGSDSLLTGQTFFKMKEMFFEDDIDDSKVSEPTYLSARTLRNSTYFGFFLENQMLYYYFDIVFSIAVTFTVLVPITTSVRPQVRPPRRRLERPSQFHLQHPGTY